MEGFLLIPTRKLNTSTQLDTRLRMERERFKCAGLQRAMEGFLLMPNLVLVP